MTNSEINKFKDESTCYAKTTNFGLVVGREYTICGRGDLTMVSDKKGYGYCVEYRYYDFNTRKERIESLYLNCQEMFDNFQTRNEYDVPYYRDLKLKQILDDEG